MYYLFLDEAGVDASQKYFALGGVIVHDSSIKSLEIELKQLLECHTGRKDATLLGLHRARKAKLKGVPNHFFGLSSDKLAEFRKEYLALLRKYGAQFMCTVIDRESHITRHGVNAWPIYTYAYMLIVERFEKFLDAQDENGFVVLGSSTKEIETSVEAMHTTLKQDGNYYNSAPVRILNGCMFSPRSSIFVQIADLVVSAVFRKYARNQNEAFSFYEAGFVRSGGGRIMGFGMKAVL
jgi:hypothetical protein